MAQSVSNEAAESIAIAALGFVAGDEDRLLRFLSLSGLDPGELRSTAGRHDFLRAFMEYVMEDEGLILALSAELHETPDRIVAAAHRLGAVPWERDHA